MKKRIKTTDSVLRDIFDTIEEQEKSAHPLSSSSAASESNRIEEFTREERPSGEFERAIEEVQKESLLFSEPPAVPMTPAGAAQEEIPAAEEIVPAEAPAPAAAIIEEPAPAPKAAVHARSHRWVVVSIVSVFSVLTVLLGSFLFIQHRQIEKSRAAQVASQASMHPAMIRLGQVPHPGIAFKTYGVKNRKLSVKGTAGSQAQLVQFLNGINASPYFTNAIIGSIAESGTGRKKAFDFQVYTDIRI